MPLRSSSLGDTLFPSHMGFLGAPINPVLSSLFTYAVVQTCPSSLAIDGTGGFWLGPVCHLVPQHLALQGALFCVMLQV